MTDAYLMHHGIKGMHWGIRRYQNTDGSLTDAGKKRYYTNSAKKELNKRTISSLMNPLSFKETLKVNHGKRAVEIAKIKDQVNNETKEKSAQRKADEKKYMDKGYSKEEAELAAKNKENTKKMLKIVGGVTLTAAVGVGAYKAHEYYINNADHKYKDGTELYRMAKTGSDNLHNNFYASPKKADARKYAGMLPNQMGKDLDWHQKTIKVAGGLNVAGAKTSRNAIETVLKNNPNTAESLKKSLKPLQQHWAMANPKAGAVFKQAIDDLDKGKYNSKSIHEAVNIGMVILGKDSEAYKGFNNLDFVNKYVGELKNRGYNAIMDVNDRKYSGYNAARPMIVFDANPATIEQNRKVGKEEIDKNMREVMGKIVAKNIVAPTAAIAGAGVAASKVAKNAQTSSDLKKINEYKKQHPNTKMSDAEILDKVYKVDRYY